MAGITDVAAPADWPLSLIVHDEAQRDELACQAKPIIAHAILVDPGPLFAPTPMRSGRQGPADELQRWLHD